MNCDDCGRGWKDVSYCILPGCPLLAALKANPRAFLSNNSTPKEKPMSEADIEKEIVDKGKTAPRVTPESIDETIIAETYFGGGEGSAVSMPGNTKTGVSIIEALHCLTICVLVLKNGFTVVGKSACASPENFDAEIGRKIARADAIREHPSRPWNLKRRRAA